MRTFQVAIALLLVGCGTTSDVVHLNARNERRYTLFPDPDSAANGTVGEVAVIGGKGKGLGLLEDEQTIVLRAKPVVPGRATAVRAPVRVVPPSRPGHV